MKFRIKVGEFLNGLEPAFSVATKGTVANFPLIDLVTVEALDGCLNIYACGGRMSIASQVSKNTHEDPRYDCQTEGRFTVRVSHIKSILASFEINHEVWVEMRSYQTDKKDDTDAASDDSDGEGTGEAQQLTGTEVVVTLVTDEEQFQTIPCFRDYISMPQYVLDFFDDKNKTKDAFEVQRDLFVYASNKILFAKGFEEGNEAYTYWVIRAKKNSLRFVAGTGPRFAVLDVDGENISNAKSAKNLLIPNDQTQPLLDVISKASYNNEKIYFYQTDKWLIISCSTFKIAICNYHADVKWPDENIILNRKNSLVFTTKIADWSHAVLGINATWHKDIKQMHDIHYATMDINFKKGELAAKTDGIMRANRKIPIKNNKVDDSDLSKSGNVVFTCVSQYIGEAIKNGAADEYIQVEVASPKSPIIFRYHADSNGDIKSPDVLTRKNEIYDISERFSIFFAATKKQDN